MVSVTALKQEPLKLGGAFFLCKIVSLRILKPKSCRTTLITPILWYVPVIQIVEPSFNIFINPTFQLLLAFRTESIAAVFHIGKSKFCEYLLLETINIFNRFN